MPCDNLIYSNLFHVPINANHGAGIWIPTDLPHKIHKWPSFVGFYIPAPWFADGFIHSWWAECVWCPCRRSENPGVCENERRPLTGYLRSIGKMHGLRNLEVFFFHMESLNRSRENGDIYIYIYIWRFMNCGKHQHGDSWNLQNKASSILWIQTNHQSHESHECDLEAANEMARSLDLQCFTYVFYISRLTPFQK